MGHHITTRAKTDEKEKVKKPSLHDFKTYYGIDRSFKII